MKLIILTSFLIILPALFIHGQVEFMSEKEVFLQAAEKVTGSENLSYVVRDSVRFAVFLDDENNKKYFVESMDFKRIYGYRGYTNLGIIFNSNGEIASVELIDSQDTRNYVRLIQRSNFFDQFKGYDGSSDFFTVTQATITSQAINETIEYTANKVRTLLKELQKNPDQISND